jgi:hypothetical protein
MMLNETTTKHAEGEDNSPSVKSIIYLLSGVLLFCWVGRGFCVLLPVSPFIFNQTGLPSFRAIGDILSIISLLATGIWLVSGRVNRSQFITTLFIVGITSILLIWQLVDSMMGLSINSIISLLPLLTAFDTIGNFAALLILFHLVMATPRKMLIWVAGLLFAMQFSVVMSVVVNISMFSHMLLYDKVSIASICMKLADIAIPILFVIALFIWRFPQKFFAVILYSIIIISVLSAVIWGATQIPLVGKGEWERFNIITGMALISLIEGIILFQIIRWTIDIDKKR